VAEANSERCWSCSRFQSADDEEQTLSSCAQVSINTPCIVLYNTRPVVLKKWPAILPWWWIRDTVNEGTARMAPSFQLSFHPGQAPVDACRLTMLLFWSESNPPVRKSQCPYLFVAQTNHTSTRLRQETNSQNELLPSPPIWPRAIGICTRDTHGLQVNTSFFVPGSYYTTQSTSLHPLQNRHFNE